MKSRTRAIGAIGATVGTASLVLALTFGGDSVANGATPTIPTTPTTVSMPMTQMPDMGSTMTDDSAGMSTMMGTADMAEMHAMMHQMMKGNVDDDALAACDEAHSAMSDSTTTMPEQGETQHDEHHAGTGS